MDNSKRLSTHVIGIGEGRQVGGKASQERHTLVQDVIYQIEDDIVIVAFTGSSRRTVQSKNLLC